VLAIGVWHEAMKDGVGGVERRREGGREGGREGKREDSGLAIGLCSRVSSGSSLKPPPRS
jgi:hypothetical protein